MTDDRSTGADDLHLCPPCDRGDHGDCYELSGKGLDVCECPRHPRPTGADDLAARLNDRVRRHTEFKRRWDRLHAADDEREQTRG